MSSRGARLRAARVVLVAAALTAVWGWAPPAVGAGLLKRAGPSGCFGGKAGCRKLLGRKSLAAHVMSPDGRTLYASGGGDFDLGGNLVVPLRVRRDLTLALPGRKCSKGNGGCIRLSRSLHVEDMELSRDGRSLYVAASGRLLAFRPDANGKLGTPAQIAAVLPAGNPAPTFDAIALSADDRHLYAHVSGSGGTGGDGIIGFERNAASGALTRLPAPGGCARDTGGPASPTFAGCSSARGIAGSSEIALSPDGNGVYVTGALPSGSAVIAVLQRDGETGAIRQASGDRGCVAGPGIPGCLAAPAMVTFLGAATPEALVPGAGRRLYVGIDGDEVVVLREDPDGGLRPAAPGVCPGSGEGRACASLRGVDFNDVVTGLALGPQGALYAVGSNGVAILRRGRDGALRQSPRRGGCTSNLNPFSCLPLTGHGTSLDGTLVPTPSGRGVYVNDTTGGGTDGNVQLLTAAPGRPSTRRKARLAFAAGDPDETNVGTLYSASIGDGRIRLLRVLRPCNDGVFTQVSFDRHGHLAYVRAGCRGRDGVVVGRIYGRQRRVAPGDHPALSHSGRYLAYHVSFERRTGSEDLIRVLDRRTGRRWTVARDADEPAFGPRGRIAFTRIVDRSDKAIATTTLRGGLRQLTRIPHCRSHRRGFPGCDVAEGFPAWTPHGSVVFTRTTTITTEPDPDECAEGCDSRETSNLFILRPGGRPRRLTRTGDVGPPAVSPSGRWLAYERSGTIWVRRLHRRHARARVVADGFDPAWVSGP